jgi:radical SAM superfamily enzyme YgiQ (UPF0313 family)
VPPRPLNMKLLFLSANRLRLIAPPLPLGLASVVAAVQGDHEVRVLDFMFAADPLGEVRRSLKEFQPEVIGISIRNIDNQDSRHPVCYFPELKELLALVRELSAAPVILGGAGFSVMAPQFMAYLEADFGLVGEGEEGCRAFLNELSGGRNWPEVPGLAWREGAEVRFNPLQRVAVLGSLPAPALEFFTPREYQEAEGSAKLPGMIPVQSRRGCPMKCIYCTTPKLEGNKVRAWEPSQVASWLASWHEQWGLTRFYFVDNMFNCPLDYARRLCQAIYDLHLPLEWGCLINPAFPDRELFRLIRRAGGTMAQVGNESGSELVLKALGKGFRRAQVEETFRGLKEEGLDFSCFLLLGGPDETRDTVRESVAFVESYQPRLVNLTVGIRIHPGLPIHRRALAEGVVSPEDDLLWPKFYLAPGLDDWIWDYLAEVTARHPNWIF